MKVWLTSGKFESQISVPLLASDDERKRFTDAWADLMIAGVRLGQKL